MATELTWHDVLADEKQQPYFINTLHTVAGERQSGITVYPPQKDVFNAFRFTELGDVKVVILGQDPYHGPGQAHGLAFSVRPGIAPPAIISEYVQRAGSLHSRLCSPRARLSGKLGAPGRTVTEYGAHGTGRPGALSCQPGVGNLYG
ncbi:uracil-DNA glycosylase [Salmonella enterica subsp. enterica serovar Typhimurium]|nr:uracil-DNA glycosylase [Salmonella enterica subsp. enterica serovar Typhimurium]